MLKIPKDNIRLGIGLPISGHQRDDDFWLSFISMQKPGCRLYVPDNPIGDFASDIAVVRNDLVKQAMADDRTHLVMMDTDQIYPPDTIMKLIGHARTGIPMVVVPVHRRYAPYELILMRGEPDRYYYVPDEEKYSGQLIEVDASGAGCIMIALNALKKIPEPWFELGFTPAGKPMGEDIGFCSKMRKAGHRIWADTSIPIDHIAKIRINREFYELSKRLNPHELNTQGEE